MYVLSFRGALAPKNLTVLSIRSIKPIRYYLIINKEL